MGIDAIFDTHNWALVPFHFWSLVFFAFGCIVGSFLNVCIYRMPLDLSIVTPPSHCPHCKYAIPFYLNVPLLTWLLLRGRCKNCAAPISPRYFIVELLTGLMFLSCWLMFGRQSVWLALVYTIFLAGLITATFIDFEHFIIPDEITLGGAAAGLVISFLLPRLHEATTNGQGMGRGLVGLAAGAGIVYAILRLGKLMFGKYQIDLDAESRAVFTESAILLPPKRLILEQLYQRRSGWFAFKAEQVELIQCCYWKATVAISAKKILLRTSSSLEEFNRDDVPFIKAVFERKLSSREAARLVGVRFDFFHLLTDWFYSLFESLTNKPKAKLFLGAHLIFEPMDTWLHWNDRMYEYGEIFYRKTDTISFHARKVEMQFSSWRDVPVRLTPSKLIVGDAEFSPDSVSHMEVVTDKMLLPREAMGLGDVKFMGAIGAFIGWQGALFSLMVSSMIGAAVGVVLILMGKREWSSRMPYGPYIALAAVIWLFGGKDVFHALFAI